MIKKMQRFIDLIISAALLLAANPGMNFLSLLEIAGELRSKNEGTVIPTPDEFFRHFQENCTPEVVENIFKSAKILVETLTVETDCQGVPLSFGRIMDSFKEQRWHSSDPGDLPPTYGLPRIILTFEVWDIVGSLHLHMQMQNLSIGHPTPDFSADIDM